jgi:hypothetical protein
MVAGQRTGSGTDIERRIRLFNAQSGSSNECEFGHDAPRIVSSARADVLT